MAEYINKKTAISLIKQYGHDAIDGGRYSLDTVDDCIELANRIEALPTEDVAPVVRGWWVRKNQHDKESSVICSVCGRMFDYIDGVCYLVSGSELPFFCPACGAKMDGKEDKDG